MNVLATGSSPPVGPELAADAGPDARVAEPVRRDAEPGAAGFVWCVWAAMLTFVLGCVALYGRNVPLAEDWLMVPQLTGNGQGLASWLWEQNQEHRIPLTKALYLVLLELAGGDFRVGMLYNTLALGALAAAMVVAVRRARGGATRFADAFFPIALLHIGDWDNLVWGWQIHFVMTTILVSALLLVIVGQPGLIAPRAAWVAGACLVMLPLCGAGGLIFAPILGLWATYAGALHLRAAGRNDARRSTGLVLLASAAVALLFTGLYFVDYQRATWNPPSPSHTETLKTAAKFLALGFGPAAGRWWPLGVGAAAAALAPVAALLVAAVVRARRDERARPLGLLLFMLGMAALALAVGWGRAAQVPTVGLPSRYVVLAVPALCAAYLALELYGAPALRNVVQMGLLVAICTAIPLNVQTGFEWRDWYTKGMDAVESDVEAGVPRSELAARHRAFLLHWDEAKLSAGMLMLHDAGLGPFRRMREDPAVDEPPPDGPPLDRTPGADAEPSAVTTPADTPAAPPPR